MGSVAPITLTSPVNSSSTMSTYCGGAVNSPRDSTGSNSSGFESLKGPTSASPSNASFRSATTLLVDSPQSRISMNSSHSNDSGPSSHSSSSVDTLDDSLHGSSLDVTTMVQKGVHEGEILALWFERLEHTEYLSKFLTQGYDLSSIARITPEDLTALGITNPQHRAKLMAEIKSWHITDSWPSSIPPGGLREWLSIMGLPEYADMFESQGYATVDMIMKLCPEDFEGIGVKRLGHLKRLQLATKKLKDHRYQAAQQQRSIQYPVRSPVHSARSMHDPPPPAPTSILKKPTTVLTDIDYPSYTRSGKSSRYEPLNLNLTATSKILSDRSIIDQPTNSTYQGGGIDCPPPPAPLSYDRRKDWKARSETSSTSTLNANNLFYDDSDTGTIRARHKVKPLPPDHLISRIGLGSTFFHDPLTTNDEPTIDENPLDDLGSMLQDLMKGLDSQTSSLKKEPSAMSNFPV